MDIICPSLSAHILNKDKIFPWYCSCKKVQKVTQQNWISLAKKSHLNTGGLLGTALCGLLCTRHTLRCIMGTHNLNPITSFSVHVNGITIRTDWPKQVIMCQCTSFSVESGSVFAGVAMFNKQCVSEMIKRKAVALAALLCSPSKLVDIRFQFNTELPPSLSQCLKYRQCLKRAANQVHTHTHTRSRAWWTPPLSVMCGEPSPKGYDCFS